MAVSAVGVERRIRAALRALRREPVAASASVGTTCLDLAGVEEVFCRELPTPNTALDIFRGQWSSDFPEPFQGLTGGSAKLFEDGRITYADEQFGGIKGMRIIELGPLEGGHSYMLDRLGAAKVTAVEGNQRAFLRCLVAKELLGMPSVRFHCGDFMPFLRAATEEGRSWDLCLAVGVLYHQPDPVALLELATVISDRLLLWTHYYDAEALKSIPSIAANYSGPITTTTAGYEHVLYRHEYGTALGRSGFCGGLQTWTSWMTRNGILGAIEHFGFEVKGITFDHRTHQNGPAFCLVAERNRGRQEVP